MVVSPAPKAKIKKVEEEPEDTGSESSEQAQSELPLSFPPIRSHHREVEVGT